LKAFEKEIQKKEEYKYYSSKDIIRDFKRHRYYEKIICTSKDGEVLEFKSQAECGRYFNCDRTNISKALKTNYKLMRKYTVSFK